MGTLDQQYDEQTMNGFRLYDLFRYLSSVRLSEV
jgi:hypothetical protein